MQRVIFYISYIFLWSISWLPLRIQFIFSDILFLIIYYVVGYRKKIVRQNLKRSFPEKRKEELRKIERQFYLHLCDSFVEWMYPLHRSAEQMKKHYTVLNPEVLHNLFNEGKSVVGILGHYANWEYLSLLPVYINHKVWAIHKPLKNRFFSRLINDLRSRYGVHMVSVKESFRTLIDEAQKGEKTLTYFLADQSPQRSKIKYWTTFLNQDTPIFLGAEQIAIKLNMAVVFFDCRKTGRGKYELHFELLTAEPGKCAPNEITEMHVRALERAIRRDPAWWLWSHRRWKHRKMD